MLRCPSILFQSIKEANQAFIIRTINQHFFNRENSFNFVSGFIKKVHKCRIPRCEIHLVLEQKKKSNWSMIAKGEIGSRQDEYRKNQSKVSR
jgi:hypothetical protein